MPDVLPQCSSIGSLDKRLPVNPGSWGRQKFLNIYRIYYAIDLLLGLDIRLMATYSNVIQRWCEGIFCLLTRFPQFLLTRWNKGQASDWRAPQDFHLLIHSRWVACHMLKEFMNGSRNELVLSCDLPGATRC